APTALDPFNRARRWANYCHFVSSSCRDQLAQPFATVNGELGRRIFHQSAEDDVHETHVRRIRWIRSTNHLITHERDVIVGDRVADRVMAWQRGLNEHSTTFGAATGSARHLTKKLKAALGRS